VKSSFFCPSVDRVSSPHLTPIVPFGEYSLEASGAKTPLSWRWRSSRFLRFESKSLAPQCLQKMSIPGVDHIFHLPRFHFMGPAMHHTMKAADPGFHSAPPFPIGFHDKVVMIFLPFTSHPLSCGEEGASTRPKPKSPALGLTDSSCTRSRLVQYLHSLFRLSLWIPRSRM